MFSMIKAFKKGEIKGKKSEYYAFSSLNKQVEKKVWKMEVGMKFTVKTQITFFHKAVFVFCFLSKIY